MALDMQQAEDLAARIRRQCGEELADLCEFYREQAHIDLENAQTEGLRLTIQAQAVVYRDLAILWRGEHEAESARAIAADDAAAAGHE
jgi:hypothetical protein